MKHKGQSVETERAKLNRGPLLLCAALTTQLNASKHLLLCQSGMNTLLTRSLVLQTKRGRDTITERERKEEKEDNVQVL